MESNLTTRFAHAMAILSDSKRRAWRLGLDRMQELMRLGGLDDALGASHPQYIQVAGTNGKGSVTATLQYLLMGQGYRTGGYFSPFVYDFRERIQINAEYISDELFCDVLEQLEPSIEILDESDMGGPSEFELKTAMAIAAWRRTRCDWVALEVGLGGRLDATSVVTPRCLVITSIGLDHQAILGDSLAAIAGEKVGALKPGVPLVTGRLPEEALEVSRRRAEELGSRHFRFGVDFGVDGREIWSAGSEKRWTVPDTFLRGFHQMVNAACAVTALDVAGALQNPSVVEDSLRKVKIPGRFEIRNHDGVKVILDGAHNAEAAATLAATLQEDGAHDLLLVTGMLEGHDCAAFFGPLLELVSEVWACPIDFFRSLPASEIKESFRQISEIPVHESAASSQAIELALERASRTGSTVLVTGSFYLVGEVGNWLSRE